MNTQQTKVKKKAEEFNDTIQMKVVRKTSEKDHEIPTVLVEKTNEKKIDWFHIGLNILNIAGILLTLWAFYWSYQNQLFTSKDALSQFLFSMGSAAPIGFILIQIIQTVIPIIPGAVTVPMGSMIFGVWYGLFLNLFAIIIGSAINFLLAKKYGRPFVQKIIGEKQFNKAIRWLDKDDKFDKWFTFAMFFPFSPDDIICYIAGLSKMAFKKYLAILLIAKPFSIFVYSLGMAKVLEWLFAVLA